MTENNVAQEPESWFDDEAELLAAVRVAQFERAAPLMIDGYEDLEPVFSGGQGVVYRGRSKATGQAIAIKIIRDDLLAGDGARRRFEREIDVMTRLSHPNVVRVHDTGTTCDGRRYLAMDYVDGLPLDEFVLGPGRDEIDRLPLDRVLRLVAQICDAVHAAHRVGALHRDLKPGNVRVDTTGRVQVLDFGLAAAIGPATGSSPFSVTTGGAVGSLGWTSPEQIEASGPVDVRSDVYSLGVILYFLLTAQMPYESSASIRDVLDAIVAGSVVPLKQYRSLPDDVVAIVMRCLETDRERRYESAGALATDLRRHLAGQPIEIARENAWHRAQLTVRRYRTAMMIGAVATVMLGVAIVIGILWQQARTARERATSEQAAAVRSNNDAQAAISVLSDMLGTLDPASGAETAAVRTMLDQATHRVMSSRESERVQAHVASVLAATYLNLGELDRAHELASHALMCLADEDQDDEMLPNIRAEASDVLARVHHARGDFAAAAKLFDEANNALHGSNNPSRALHGQIASAQLDAARGRHDLARTTLLEVVKQAPVVAPHDQELLGVAETALADICLNLGDAESAEQLVDSAIPRLEAGSGPNSLFTADAHLARARIRLHYRDGREASREARTAMATIESHVGRQHPAIGYCLFVLADATFCGGDGVSNARDYADEALAINAAVTGTESLPYAYALERSAQIYRLTNDNTEAIARLRRALKIYDAMLTPEHRQRLLALGQLGGVLAGAGACDEAAPLLDEAISRLEEQSDPQLPDLVLMRRWRARCPAVSPSQR